MPSPAIILPNILIVGAGGLGHPTLWGILNEFPRDQELYIRICDPETVELSNLNRQVFFQTADVGKPKAEALVRRISELLPLSLSWTIEASDVAFTTETAGALLQNVHCVIDACDSVEAKLLMNDLCVTNQIFLVHGGVISDYGQVLAYNPEDADSGCLRCLFDSFSDEDFRQYATTCQAAGILGAAAGVVGFEMARQALRLLLAPDSQTHSLSFHSGSTIVRLPSFTENSQRRNLQQGAVLASPDCSLGCADRSRRELNLAGEKCPNTYVYTKLALEKIEAGETLLVRFDNKESAENVSKSVQAEGHLVKHRLPGIAQDSHLLVIAKHQRDSIASAHVERTLSR